MRILVDGTPLLRFSTGGVGRYTKCLLEATTKLDKHSSYHIYAFQMRKSSPTPLEKPNIYWHWIRYIPRQVYNLLHREIGIVPPVDLLARIKPDVTFFPNFVRFPLFFKTPSVVVVYDLAFLKYGHFLTKRHLRFLKRFVPISVRKASIVISDSEHNKKDLIKHYRVPPEKVVVIPGAIDHSHFRPATKADISKVRKKYKLPDKYILHVGTFEQRKNIVGLAAAFTRLSPEIKKDYPLVLVGGKGWKNTLIYDQLSHLIKNGEPINIIGFVEDEDLPAVYSGASLFTFVPFYEGFGIPPLEAMACGTPVVASNNSSLPEVIGKAGLLVRAEDTNEISSAIATVLNNKVLANKLRAAGFNQARKFTWQESAKKLLDVFAQLKK